MNSKLDYADNVGLLNWTATEASEHVSLLASGSRTSASMEMSAPKSTGMRVHVQERLPMSKEVDVNALDLPHSCPECERSFRTRRGLAVHRARWCRPGQRPASRRGQLADQAVKLVKRQASAALRQPVVMEGESLETVYQFDYLGCRITSMQRHSYHRTAFTIIGQDDQHSYQVTGTQLVRLATGDIRKRLYS